MSEGIPQFVTFAGNQPQKKWTDVCKEFIKRVKSMKPKDRLEYASYIADLLYIINVTVNGWAQWYKMEFSKAFGHKPLSEMSEEQFKQTFEFFKTIAVNMLDFDIKITEVTEKKSEEEEVKKKPKKKSINGRREYTA